MKELVVVAQNQVGVLADVSEALGNVGVNIDAISAYESKGDAHFRVVTADPQTAKKALMKIPSITSVHEADVVVFRLSNRPGELGKLTRKIANRKINLESVYILSRTTDFTEVAVKPTAVDFAQTVALMESLR